MTPEELLEKAMKKARQDASNQRDRQKADLARIDTFTNTILDKITYLLKRSKRDLTPFQREIITTHVSLQDLKSDRRRAEESAKIIKKIHNEYRMKAKYARNFRESGEIRKQYYGRIKSILKKMNFENMEKFYSILPKLPRIKDEPTVIICGPPNVGKSEFLGNVSGKKVETQPYPFTTKHVLIGHSQIGYLTYQWVDTPGILDRPPEKRNEMEKRAVAALKHVSKKMLFLVDPSEACGTPLKDQYLLLERIKKEFQPEKIVLISTHADITKENTENAIATIDTRDKEQVKKAAELAIEKLF